MRRQIFWVIAALVLGFMAHIAYLLFVPSRSLSQSIDVAVGDGHENSFALLSPESQLQLIPASAENHVVGVCKFDLASGPVRMTAQLPEGFWSFAVYTIRGRQVYAINDQQADTNSFTVELSRQDGFIAQVLGGEATKEIVSDDIGWRIAVAERQGLAVLWLAVADPLLRKNAEDVLRGSRCVTVQG
jgi:uncharacterized membrane protein